MRISVCCPSYRRPRVETLDVYPNTRVYVAEAEYADYVAANPKGSDIVAVPDSVQGNLARVRNYIMDREFEDSADCVVIIDDDMDGVFRFVSEQREKGLFGYKSERLGEEELFLFAEEASALCDEWGYKFWGVNCVHDPKAYRQMTPFNTTKYIGGPFQAFLPNPIRYDESLPLKEDYDMTLQHLKEYGGALRFNAYSYLCKQAEQVGGCAEYRNLIKEAEQFERLQRKWGSKIIRKDKGSRRKFDFNPVLRSPIAGV